jgi:transcriptional regulator with XRE-family HTH domain
MPEASKRRASQVFGERLKATRQRRRWTQQELAERMTDAGVPMSKTTLVRIEQGKGERGLSLDEALAFAVVIGASPTHLLTPAADETIALTDKHQVLDALAIRDWLRTGVQSRSTTRNDDGRLVGEDNFVAGRSTAVMRERFERQIAELSEAMLDAYRGEDKAGTQDAVRSIFDAVDAYRADEKAGNHGA